MSENIYKLTNVIDLRSNQFHSVAIVKEHNLKYFAPFVQDEPNEEPFIDLSDDEEVEEAEEIEDADEE